jgi:uncharacterized BrkB/YihY/UPF0761 family membrane protein
MKFLLGYLLITLLVGVVVKLLTAAAREDVGILYERKYWNNGYDDMYVTIALTYAYIVTFSFAICYWIYKLCTRRKN